MTIRPVPAKFGRVEFYLGDTYMGVVMPVAKDEFMARPVNSGGIVVASYPAAYRVICSSEKAKRMGVIVCG